MDLVFEYQVFMTDHYSFGTPVDPEVKIILGYSVLTEIFIDCKIPVSKVRTITHHPALLPVL